MEEHASIAWVYGWNMPGYMPDASDGAETWESARDALTWELERMDCGAPDEPEGWLMTEDERDHAIAMLQGATSGQAIDVRAGRYVYFIVEADASWRESSLD